MMTEKSNPATLAACRVRNSISLAAIDPENTADGFVLQFISRRYRLPPAIATTIALLAGIGPKEARS
jgi:hypothetical protein